jgi:outer membrane lipoprotein-sorting protein
MPCLPRAELTRIALGLESCPESSAHLQTCARCRADLESLNALVRQLDEAHAAFEEGHEQARARLLALLTSESSQLARKKSWTRVFPFLGAWTMKQQLAFGGVFLMVALASAVIWIGSAPRPAFAMNGLAESIRQARSYEYSMTMETSTTREPGKAPVKLEMKGRFSWQSPGSYRIETTGGDAMPNLDSLTILPAGKAGIEIDRKAKTYVRQPARLGQISPLMMVDRLSTFSGQADRLLGTKEIDSKTANGFQIEARKIDPDVYSGPMEIWVDSQTSLPVLIRYEVNTSGIPATIRMSDFHWNVDLDPKLFDPVPPDGYAQTPRQTSPVDDQVKRITEGLRLYAKYSGGHYPRVKMLYGDVTRDEFVRLSGAPYPPQKEADFKDARIKEVYDAVWGFSTINGILRDNADAAYHGKTVGPENKDKVLLRWKLDDGSYEIIYGDLHAEAVPAGRLRALEGR